MNPHTEKQLIRTAIEMAEIATVRGMDDETLNAIRHEDKPIEALHIPNMNEAQGITDFIGDYSNSEMPYGHIRLILSNGQNPPNNLGTIAIYKATLTDWETEEKQIISEIKYNPSIHSEKYYYRDIYAVKAEIENDMLKITDIYDIVYNIPIENDKSN